MMLDIKFCLTGHNHKKGCSSLKVVEGLYDAVCMNPELSIPVLNVMWVHFIEFYVMDEENLPPLRFDKITITKDVQVVLQEPLGKLIYTITLVLMKVKEHDVVNPTVVKFMNVLESLCDRMIKCDLVHFQLDDGTDLFDVIPESQQKMFILKEAMCVYEALIGYKIYSWDAQSENNGNKISDLHKGYCRLLHFSKNLSKPKKVESKKKGSNKTSQTQQNSTVTKSNTPKTHKHFTLPDTVLDFQVIEKTLNLLYEPVVSWTLNSEANILKSKKDFHQFIVQITNRLINKSKKSTETHFLKIHFNHLANIATVLYNRIIKRFAEFIDFDFKTAVLAVECFYAILNTICGQYKNKLALFLSKISGKENDDQLSTQLVEFIETYEKLYENVEEEDTFDDSDSKKYSLAVINTIVLFFNQISPSDIILSQKVLEWIKKMADHQPIRNKQVASVFIHLMFDTHIKYIGSLTFFEQLAILLGDVTGVINEEEHNTESLKIINIGTAQTVFISLCTAIKTVLEDIDWIINRLKAKYNMLTYSGEENVEKRNEYLKNNERGICCQLCFVVNILRNLSNCAIHPGTLSEAVLKNLSLLYNTLSSLTKYFILRSTKNNAVFEKARFDRLVRLAGKQLTNIIYKFITYLEEHQKQSEQTQSKKNVDTSTLKSKVLKETRLIPKVIFEIEQFGKCIIQLSNKTGVDLSKIVGQGTVRDFRIMHLKEVLEQTDDSRTQDVHSQSQSDVEMEEVIDEETSEPPSKMSKFNN